MCSVPRNTSFCGYLFRKLRRPGSCKIQHSEHPQRSSGACRGYAARAMLHMLELLHWLHRSACPVVLLVAERGGGKVFVVQGARRAGAQAATGRDEAHLGGGPESSPGSDEIIGYRGVQDAARAEKGKTDRRTEHNRARFESWRRTRATSDRNGIRFS